MPTLDSVCLKPEWLECAVAWPEFAGLKALRVTRAKRDNMQSGPGEDYDYSRMSSALVTHLPDIEVPEWSYQGWDKEWGSLASFGSLRGLSKLTLLVLDYNFLTTRHGYENKRPVHLLSPEEYLLKSL